MIAADFEESEFRGPLYNQLERGNHLIWEPGQVFEKHIGIDRGSFVTDRFFWALHRRGVPLGLVLADHEWRAGWNRAVTDKELPDFKLNLFLQAKRPHAGTRPTAKVRKKGITAPFWKFEVTPHQQRALQRLTKEIGRRGLVCYAAPAFHTQSALNQHTRDRDIVKHSTFPKATVLENHGNWYYDAAGTFGVANPEFVRVDTQPIDQLILEIIRDSEPTNERPAESLANLTAALLRATAQVEAPSSDDTWALLQLARAEQTAADLGTDLDLSQEVKRSLKHYFQARAFCAAYHLDWYVVGKGG